MDRPAVDRREDALVGAAPAHRKRPWEPPGGPGVAPDPETGADDAVAKVWRTITVTLEIEVLRDADQ